MLMVRSAVRLVRLAFGAAAVAMLLVGVDAGPAAAHGAGGIEPTNFETQILRVRPHVAGVRVRPVDLGDRLELTNESARDVIVLGYEGEPYLRVGPGGTFENTRSPALYLNRERRSFGSVPVFADAEAEPVWRRIGDDPTVRWHDHRAHWMGADDPPAVRRDRDATQLVQRFSIDLRHAGQTIAVEGAVRWIPGPSPWPWVAATVVFGVIVLVGTRSRRWVLALGGALAVLIVAQAVHIAGLWGGNTESVGSRLGASAYSIGGSALAIGALVLLARRGGHTAVPLALLAGLFLALAGGLADVTAFARSQLPTTLPGWLDRLAVAATLGVGAGLVAGAALRLRRTPEPRATVDAPPAAAVPTAAMEARYRSPTG